MGLSVWESKHEGTGQITKSYGNLSQDIYAWQLAGPFETRNMKFPAAPMPSLIDSTGVPLSMAKRNRNGGRMSRRKERRIIEWINRDDLSPKVVSKSPRRKLKPLAAETQPVMESKPVFSSMPHLPRISIDGVLPGRKPLSRYNWFDHQIYHKEVKFTPPGHRRTKNQYNHPEMLKYPQWSLESVREKHTKPLKHRGPRLDPLQANTSRPPKSIPPPPPQSITTQAQSKAPTNTEEDNNAASDETNQQDISPRVGWDPRRHYLQAHFRGLDTCREDDFTTIPCDLRDPNDSFAYKDVIEYMLDNDLMSLAKIRHITKWIDGTLLPGFVYDEQSAWFIAIDPELEWKSISSSISSISHKT